MLYDEPSEADRYQMIRTYFEMLIEEEMPGAEGKMKQFASWFTHGVAGGAALRKAIYESKSRVEILTNVEAFFENRLELVWRGRSGPRGFNLHSLTMLGQLALRPPRLSLPSPRFLCRLHVVSLHDRHDQSGKALVDFRAARRVAHLDPDTLPSNQTGLPERLEVLGEGGLGDGFLADAG